VDFPFTVSGPGKPRPALVILDTGDADVLLARVTTQAHAGPFDVPIRDWQQAGLLAPSTARLHKLATLAKARVPEIARTIGGTGRSAGPNPGRRGVPATPGTQTEGWRAQILFAGTEHLLAETGLGHASLRLLSPLSCEAPGPRSSCLPTMRRPGLAQPARLRAVPDIRAERAGALASLAHRGPPCTPIG
jgi:hypothetical protein